MTCRSVRVRGTDPVGLQRHTFRKKVSLEQTGEKPNVTPRLFNVQPPLLTRPQKLFTGVVEDPVRVDREVTLVLDRGPDGTYDIVETEWDEAEPGGGPRGSQESQKWTKFRRAR